MVFGAVTDTVGIYVVFRCSRHDGDLYEALIAFIFPSFGSFTLGLEKLFSNLVGLGVLNLEVG